MKPSKPLMFAAIFLFCVAFAVAPSAQAGSADQAFREGLQRQKSGQCNNAVSSFQRALSLQPAYALAWRQLAACYYVLGDLKSARHASERYLSQKPDDSTFRQWSQQRLSGKAAPVAKRKAQKWQPPSKRKARPGNQKSVKESKDKSKSLPDRPATTSWGLKLGGGYGLGLSTFEAGTDPNSGNPQQFQPGGGPALRTEVLMGLTPYWEIGLGLHPRFFNEIREATKQGTVIENSKTQVQFTTTPILATAYGRLPVTPAIYVEMGLGAGFALGGTLLVEDEYVQSYATGLTRTTTTYDTLLPGGPALRAYAGVAFNLNRSADLHLGAEYMFATFAPDSGTVTQQSVDQTGTVVSGPFQAKFVGGDSVDLSGLGLTAGMSFRF